MAQATVIYDGDCGICSRTRQTVEALDWLGTMRWISSHSDEADAFGFPREQLDRAVVIVTAGSAADGWNAVKQIVVRLPLTYLVGAALVRWKPWSVLPIAVLLSPLFNPLGDRGYAFVAENRDRLPGSTCALG